MSINHLRLPRINDNEDYTSWDLQILLYMNAASEDRKTVMKDINKGKFGSVINERLPMVYAFHETVTTFIIKGLANTTIQNNLLLLFNFYSWSDKNSYDITTENVIKVFCDWTEYLLEKVYLKNIILESTAYSNATKVSNLIARALKIQGEKPGKYILSFTRIKRPKVQKKELNTQESNQRKKDIFEFGQIITLISRNLDFKTIRGELPICINYKGTEQIVIKGSLRKPLMDLSNVKDMNLLRAAKLNRHALSADINILHESARHPLLRLKVECELLIFISQTGMNLTQAANIDRSRYRWKTQGERFIVFREFKNRKRGEVIFRCYKSYRNHFNKYLNWLEKSGIGVYDKRLFPFINNSKNRSDVMFTSFHNIKKIFESIDKPFFGPKKLRLFRMNWILQHTNDYKLTSDMASNHESSLRMYYEEPDFKTASTEILRFYSEGKGSYYLPGPGACIDENNPTSINLSSPYFPSPDCTSSEGCLFCSKHRDVMSYDYCWKLTSHAYLKNLEMKTCYISKESNKDPIYNVFNRIMEKLEAIKKYGKTQHQWIEKAGDAVRSGNYHPYWNGTIRLTEELI